MVFRLMVLMENLPAGNPVSGMSATAASHRWGG